MHFHRYREKRPKPSMSHCLPDLIMHTYEKSISILVKLQKIWTVFTLFRKIQHQMELHLVLNQSENYNCNSNLIYNLTGFENDFSMNSCPHIIRTSFATQEIAEFEYIRIHNNLLNTSDIQSGFINLSPLNVSSFMMIFHN